MLPLQVERLPRPCPVPSDQREGDVFLLTRHLYDCQSFLRLWGTDYWHAGFDNSCLLSGDLGQRVSQQIGVVIAQRSDDGYIRRDHVCGV